MTDNSLILNILETSPSVELLKLRNRKMVIGFLSNVFLNRQATKSSDSLHVELADFLEGNEGELDLESEVTAFDTFEVKSKKYIQSWTNKGFLTNYLDDEGEVYYELSSHSSKTIDWLLSLKKEEFVGAESKFNSILHQLKELVEFSNEDIENRIQILEERKLEIEHHIQRIQTGEDVKVFEEFEIVPRFNQLNQLAKELLTDFKEVEDNFKEITKSIYQKHAQGGLSKSDILGFAFEAIDELKSSQQGKSFYAFYTFLLSNELQSQWEKLTSELFEILKEKSIPANDLFLRGMKKHLHHSGQKVYKANDKMAEKLSRIIRENENSNSEIARNLINDIKKVLIELSRKKVKPDVAFELEADTDISIPFERKLLLEQSQTITYKNKPKNADDLLTNSEQLSKLFAQSGIDKAKLRKRINDVLKIKSQASLVEIIETNGGIENGLPELFGYLAILKEYKHYVNENSIRPIVFNRENKKQISIPDIVLSR